MCGIAGIIRTDGRPVDAAILDRMAARLEHRGPDQCGTWIDPARPTAGLAVRRLIVIAPAGSRQPLANEDGTVNFADYSALANNYGQSIPEPASLTLLAAGLVVLANRKRR